MQGYVRHDTATGITVHDSGGEGPAFVFQHGLCGDAAQPAAVIPTRYRHIVMEARGHGHSPLGPQGDITIATFTADLVAVIEALDTAPCIVGGISMGAAMALRLAVTRPDLVRGLVLARPAWVADAAPANLSPNAEVGALLARHDPETARATFLASDTAARLRAEAPDNLASLAGFFGRVPQSETATLLSRISADGPGVTMDDIARIAVPTLVIATDRDAIHPISLAETLADTIPQARLTRITAKSDDPAAYTRQFRAALAAFLPEVP